MLIQVLLFLAGLIVLAVAAEFLVRGATQIALVLGLPPLLVGLTIVAYGTSLPEFVVSVLAATKGSSTLALGNALGSNLLNTGLILGLAAIIFPLAADRVLFRRDLPIHLGFVLLFAAVIYNGFIGRYEGLVMIALMLVYIVGSAVFEWRARNANNAAAALEEIEEEVGERPKSIWVAVFFVLLGSAGLYFGADLMVNAAITIAQEFGISERVIGLTVVAFGTSLPELATTLAAARKKHADMIIGNLLGSNIFNLMLIVGTAGALAPFAINLRQVLVEYGFLALNAVMIYLFMWTGRKLTRIEGVVLSACYLAFVGYLLVR
ncbi:MAG TPA: calcium/sodium antiporter [bacterium]|nr:calcium/sodium antiporter [bacterium]